VGRRGRSRGQEGAAQLADSAGWGRQPTQGAPPDVGAHRSLRRPVTKSSYFFFFFIVIDFDKKKTPLEVATSVTKSTCKYFSDAHEHFSSSFEQ
jgi:hypothetical protein